MESAAAVPDNINPLALLFLLAMMGVILCASRQSAVRAVLVTAAFIPLGQQVLIFGLHFYFLRLLVLAGAVRIVTRHETVDFRLVRIDKLFLCWVLAGFVCGLLRGPSAETFGIVYDSVGVYFLIRILTRDGQDILAHVRCLAFIGIAMAAFMLYEQLTHYDLFHVLGGVPAIAVQRGDRFRCRGPFRHPILAGTFGATLLPLMVGLLLQKTERTKRLAWIGIVACSIITVASASSGPLMSYASALAGFGLWPMRDKMRFVRRGMVAAIICFALTMNAPVWYLIAKVSDLVGGGGWHRAYLIDQAVGHFSQWWLIGTSSTASWNYDGSKELGVENGNLDITNHYIVQGIDGGVAMLTLFLALIVTCYRVIGQTVHKGGASILLDKTVWALGVAFTAHCMAFISVSYFDQIKVFWFWLVSAIAVVSTQSSPAASTVPAAVEAADGFTETSAVSPR